VFVLIFFLTATACQSYTSTLQQGITGADETAAISALRAIAMAQRTYSISNSGEYGSLQQLTDGGFLDVRFSSGKPVKDYVLTLNVVPKPSGAPEGTYTCNADPDKQGAAAGHHFYIDSSTNNIHVNASQPATANDPIAQ
jgi:hypothetical protein